MEKNKMKIYVGTYAKYNNGSIAGQWLSLEDYEDKDAFHKACLELHKDEADPELMFQDWENIPDQAVGECHVDDIVWDLLELDNNDRETCLLYMKATGCKLDEAIERYEEAYRGVWESEESFAIHFADDLGYCEGDSPLLNHVDWDSWTRTLMMDHFSATDSNYNVHIFCAF
tara:strand:+ start:205 stop:720 length:516 start_codon:yes stop_codon:yes gene_type:complete